MATARDLIKRSLRLIHVLSTTEEPTAQEASDSLEALNDMLDEWAIEKSLIFASKEESITWVGGSETHTLGATGDTVTTRPTKILNSTFYTDGNGNDYNLRLIDTRVGYTSIVDKETTTDLPDILYYEPTYPDGTLYIWPVPSANLTVKLHTWQQLSQFSSLDDTVSLAPGYKNLLVYGLTEYLASEFGVAVPPEVGKQIVAVKRRMLRHNLVMPVAMVEPSTFREGRSFNIFVGD